MGGVRGQLQRAVALRLALANSTQGVRMFEMATIGFRKFVVISAKTTLAGLIVAAGVHGISIKPAQAEMYPCLPELFLVSGNVENFIAELEHTGNVNIRDCAEFLQFQLIANEFVITRQEFRLFITAAEAQEAAARAVGRPLATMNADISSSGGSDTQTDTGNSASPRRDVADGYYKFFGIPLLAMLHAPRQAAQTVQQRSSCGKTYDGESQPNGPFQFAAVPLFFAQSILSERACPLVAAAQ